MAYVTATIDIFITGFFLALALGSIITLIFQKNTRTITKGALYAYGVGLLVGGLIWVIGGWL